MKEIIFLLTSGVQFHSFRYRLEGGCGAQVL